MVRELGIIEKNIMKMMRRCALFTIHLEVDLVINFKNNMMNVDTIEGAIFNCKDGIFDNILTNLLLMEK